MIKMNSLITLSCSIVLFSTAIVAQKKTLTLSESVIGVRKIMPDRIAGFSWIPNSDNYIYVKNDTLLVSASTKLATTQNYLTLAEVNKSLPSKMRSLNGYTWRNANELIFTVKEGYYAFNLKSKTATKLGGTKEDMENITLEPVSGAIAFTKENNLFLQLNDGSLVEITSNSNKEIVSGQSIARNEYGIGEGIFWSTKGNGLAFYQKDESDVKTYPLVDITTTPAELNAIKYPMAGQGSEKPKVGIYNLASKKTVYISPRGSADSYLTNLSWTPDEKYVLIAEINRETNKYWLNKYDAITGEFVKTLLEESNDKWVEPEHPAFFPSATSSNFIWISEKDGFNNLYYYDGDGKLIKQLTANKFVAKRILRSVNGGAEIIYAATGTSPLNTLFYMVDLTGKQRCLTLEEGTHSVVVNDKGTFLMDEYSSHTVAYKSEIKSNGGKVLTTLMNSTDKLNEYTIGTTDIGQIKGKDGSVLYTRLIKPSNFDPTKKYPVLVYVYGGPHAQMITNSWLDGASLWMQWMAEQGYLVFTLDNRGSGERGFAFESQIHRQLGTLEMEDQLSGVEYLKSLPYVDGDRLAVHGWSFGGFMTTSLMLRHPDVFKVGIAGGPVTDWKYYEAMYGERYMDKPSENVEGYKNASLFTYAGALKGDLLLIHGTVDDVVVMQHNMALVKKFVELGIQMDFFLYPMHKHNVYGKDRVHLMEKVLNYVINNNK